MKSLNELAHEMLTGGTPACGIFCGIVGGIVGILLLCVGFWKTLLIVALAAVGVFIGAVKDKGTFIKNLVNKLFPPKDNG